MKYTLTGYIISNVKEEITWKKKKNVVVTTRQKNVQTKNINFFTQNDIRDDVVEKFINDIAEVYVDENRVLDCRKAILSPIAEKLSVNEKLLYLYEFDLENEFEVDLDTGKVTEIK